MDSLAAGAEGHEHGVVTEPANNTVDTLELVTKIGFLLMIFVIKTSNTNEKLK